MSEDKHQCHGEEKSRDGCAHCQATEERGVLILVMGYGKGKSSSAFGTMARSLGHGKRCAVIQFVKGRTESEYKLFKDHPQVDWFVMGHGFVGDSK